MAGNDKDSFEFQRLHGMGESLHGIVKASEGTRCRIYAPVGAHRDLLAYLVRRLLENGANSSFVNQIVDESIPPSDISRDPVKGGGGLGRPDRQPDHQAAGRAVRARAQELQGLPRERARLDPAASGRARGFRRHHMDRRADDRRVARTQGPGPRGAFARRHHPRDRHRARGHGRRGLAALDAAEGGFRDWSAKPVAERADILRKDGRSLRGQHGRTDGHRHARGRQDPARRDRRGARGGRFPALLRRRGRASGYRRAGQPARRVRLHQPVELPAGDLHRARSRRRLPSATRCWPNPPSRRR